MAAIQIILTIAFGCSGLFALLLGYLIKKNQLIEIIAMSDFSKDKIKDKAAFSHFAGNRVYLIGFTALASAVSIIFMPHFIMFIILGFIFLLILLCMEFIITSGKHFIKA